MTANKDVNDLMKELHLKREEIKNAFFKLPNYIEVMGARGGMRKEINTVIKHFSTQSLISDQLYALIVKQFKAKRNLVSVTEIEKDYRLNAAKVNQFIKELMINNKWSDLDAQNIFKHANYKYVQNRKVKGFLDQFFDWMLGNSAKFHYRLLNRETNEDDDFFALEEIQAGNSKKGRILGFDRAIDGKIEAICGFYNGTIKFMPSLQRSCSGLRSPEFDKFDQFKRPVYFSFDRAELMDRQLRTQFNLFVACLSLRPVRIQYGGQKMRVVTTNFEFKLGDFEPKESQSKTKQGLLRRQFGNINSDNFQEYLSQHLSITSIYQFLYEHTHEKGSNAATTDKEGYMQDYVSFKRSNGSTKKDTIVVSSDTYPSCFWVPKTVKAQLDKIGISAGLPLEFILEFWLKYLGDLKSGIDEKDVVKWLDNEIIQTNQTITAMIDHWCQLLGTNNRLEAMKQIDGIIKGRRKPKEDINEDDIEDDDFDDGLGE